MTISLNDELWPEYRRCFVCGADNEKGLQLELYEREGSVVARWQPRPEYANWAGIVHGGAQAAALDELAGVAAWIAFRRRDGDEWPFVVSAEFTVRFRAPARIGQSLDVNARVIELRDHQAFVEAHLEAEATTVTSMAGRYVKLDQPVE